MLSRVEEHSDLDNLSDKAYTYLLYFDYTRKNRRWDRMSPAEILSSDKDNNLDPGILNLPPVVLTHLIKDSEDDYLAPAAVTLWCKIA